MNKPERIWEKHFPQGAKWNEKFNITSLCELLDESAKKFKDKTVFEYRDTKITYGDFGNMVQKLSQGLPRVYARHNSPRCTSRRNYHKPAVRYNSV